jgi:GGDEF domain-containing protein
MGDADADAEVRIPRSALGSVQRALASVHAAALHAAFAEQRARETDLRQQTRRDSLTGLANRVLLQERLEELLAAEAPLCVVFCDLDDFKRINDTHGHAVGDEVLRAMGTRLARRLAAADVVARIGGDEFVVVAAGVRQQDAPGHTPGSVPVHDRGGYA